MKNIHQSHFLGTKLKIISQTDNRILIKRIHERAPYILIEKDTLKSKYYKNNPLNKEE